MRNLAFEKAALDDLAWWIQHDRKTALRIIRIVQETAENPFGGIGKPEPLRHDLAGCWSKRIDDEHRMVYRVTDTQVQVITCRYHY